MKRVMLAAFVLAPLTIGAQPFYYIGAFPTTALNPSVISLDHYTDNIYYSDFDGHIVYKVALPIAAVGSTSAPDSVFADLSGLAWESGRGIQGLAVSCSTAEVFVTGDNGGGSPLGFIRKYSSLTGTEDTAFNSAADALNIRSEGCAVLRDITLAVSTFGGIEYLAVADASQTGYTASSGAPNYTREISYNPIDELIYPSRNGDYSAVKIAGYYGSGTASTGGYTFTATDLIATGAINTQYGTATSHGCFDPDNSRYFSVENDSSVSDVTVWNVTNNGLTFTLVETIDVTASLITGYDGVSLYDAVYDPPYLYVTAYFTDSTTTIPNSGYVLAFDDIGDPADVEDWTMLD